MKLNRILVLFFTILLVACSDDEHLIFENKEEAELVIDELVTPEMPEGYQINKITHDNDGFTHPVTKVFYEKENSSISFMIASSWFDDDPSEKIKNDKIDEMIWITREKEFVLKWRNSNQDSYKYLFTNNKKDRDWLISLAENYQVK